MMDDCWAGLVYEDFGEQCAVLVVQERVSAQTCLRARGTS